MSLKDKEKEMLKFDTRLLERGMRKGVISQAEFDQHISSLPDCSENMIKLGEKEGNRDNVPSDSFEGH